MHARPAFVHLHRWFGLGMSLFLIIIGLTGSLLCFNVELERVFAPHLFASPKHNLPNLDLATLIENAQAKIPEAHVVGATYTEYDQVKIDFTPIFDSGLGKLTKLDFDEFYVDPWTGAELGRRQSLDISKGLANLMPFIYDLHWRLACGDFGKALFGVLALVWTFDCFIAFYFTLPQTYQGFWQRWKLAWKIKFNTNFHRLNFDLHRASGLWFWLLLLIFAWSGVMMDLRPVYELAMNSIFDYQQNLTIPQSQNEQRRLDWKSAQRFGERLIKEQAALKGFKYSAPQSLFYNPETNIYYYTVKGSHDLFERSPKGSGTWVAFSADSGELVQFRQPTGEHLGNTIESWLYALHMARVFGLPYRLLVCLTGCVCIF